MTIAERASRDEAHEKAHGQRNADRGLAVAHVLAWCVLTPRTMLANQQARNDYTRLALPVLHEIGEQRRQRVRAAGDAAAAAGIADLRARLR